MTFLEKLDNMLELQHDWDSYGAQPPNKEAVANAKLYLSVAEMFGLVPKTVLPSCVGGVGISYSTGCKRVYVECRNTGTMNMLLSDKEKNVLEVKAIDPSIEQLQTIVNDFKNFLGADEVHT